MRVLNQTDLQLVVDTVNEYIKDKYKHCPLIDLDTVKCIINHQDVSVADAMLRLEPVIKIDKLFKLTIRESRRKKLIDKLFNGDEKEYEKRRQEGILPDKQKSGPSNK